MSAGGHMIDFYKRVQANSMLLKKRKTTFEVLEDYEHAPKIPLKVKKGTKAQAESFIQKYKERLYHDQRKRPYIIIASIILSIAFILSLVKVIELIFLSSGNRLLF